MVPINNNTSNVIEDSEAEWEDVPQSQEEYEADVNKEIYSQEDDTQFMAEACSSQQQQQQPSKKGKLRIQSDEDELAEEPDEKKRKLAPLPPPPPPSQKRTTGNNARAKRQKTLDEGVYTSVNEEGWPTLAEVKAPKIKPFSSLSQEEVFLIVDHDKKNETYRGETKENLHIVLREKDRSKPIIQCRASAVLKKALEQEHDFYKKVKSYNFFLTHNGEKPSKLHPGNKYNDFSIFVRAKVKLSTPQ